MTDFERGYQQGYADAMGWKTQNYLEHLPSRQPQPVSLVYRLRKRAEIRRQINTRKSVQEGAPDRIADLLDEAADELSKLQSDILLQTHEGVGNAN